MKISKVIITLSVLLFSAFTLSGCGKKSDVTFSADSETGEVVPYVDEKANEKINITQSYGLNQEFKVQYKTSNPDGQGTAQFKAQSIKEIDMAGKRTPEEGKKLVLVEIAIKGTSTNKGEPSNFNQIGDTPSPQFVIIDKNNNKSYVEETYYSDGYTADKNLFELTKITLDHEQLVNTAIVFQIDKNLEPNLAFRFTNLDGKTEFYDIEQ